MLNTIWISWSISHFFAHLSADNLYHINGTHGGCFNEFKFNGEKFHVQIAVENFLLSGRSHDGRRRRRRRQEKKKLCEARTFCRRILIYELFTYENALMIS